MRLLFTSKVVHGQTVGPRCRVLPERRGATLGEARQGGRVAGKRHTPPLCILEHMGLGPHPISMWILAPSADHLGHMHLPVMATLAQRLHPQVTISAGCIAGKLRVSRSDGALAQPCGALSSRGTRALCLPIILDNPSP